MSTDVLVLGGGIMGLACARELAGRGMRVSVVESEERIAVDGWRAASWAAAGMLAPLSEAPKAGPLFEAARASRDLWPSFAAELRAESGLSVEHDDDGALMVALDESDEARLDALVAAGRELGEPVHEVSLAWARERVPDLGSGPATGESSKLRRVLHLPGEHRVDNHQACRALELAAERLGVEVLRGHRVEAIHATPSEVSVEGDGWHVSAPWLVLAAGSWSGLPTGLPPLPLTPVRGEMLRLEGVGWPWGGTVRGAGIYTVRRGPGSLLVGATEELVGFDRNTTETAARYLLEALGRLLPARAGQSPTRHWAGLRPGTPDHLPILGPLSDEHRRVVVATGHYRHGILMAPWTARQVARWISGGAPDPDAEEFAPIRFAELSSVRPPV